MEAMDEDYADGYEWYALVTDLDMDARDILPLYRERGDCENIFARLGEDGAHREATTSRHLLQSCIARVSRHARRGIVTIYTSASEKALSAYRAIGDFLAKVASASQLTVEWRRRAIIAYAFREYGILRRFLPPIIGDQMMLPLT